MLGEEGRDVTQNRGAMTIALVEVEGPEKHHSEYLVLPVAMGGLAERVVCKGVNRFTVSCCRRN